MKKIIMLVAGLVLGASAMAQPVVVVGDHNGRVVRHDVRHEVRHDRERMRMMRERERMRMMRHHRHHRNVVFVR